MNREEQPVLRPEELAAWTAQRPPKGFADRVLAELDEAEVLSIGDRPDVVRAQWGRRALVAAVACAAATVLAVWLGMDVDPVKGGGRYEERTTLVLAAHVQVEAQGGSELVWERRADELRIDQRLGAARYEVEPGAAVVVDTPLGSATLDGADATISVDESATDPVVVDVHRGAVTLTWSTGTIMLRSGERWPSDVDHGRVAPLPMDRTVAVAPVPASSTGTSDSERGGRARSRGAGRRTTDGGPVAAETPARPEPPTAGDTPAPETVGTRDERQAPVDAPRSVAIGVAEQRQFGLTIDAGPNVRYSARCRIQGGSERIAISQGELSVDFARSEFPLTCTLRLRSRGWLEYELESPGGVVRGRLDRREPKAVLTR